MNTELATIMSNEGRVIEWANNIKYNADLTSEDKEISSVIDAWAKEIGQTGRDKECRLAELITKTVTRDVVSAPSELISAMFDEESIGEFDDHRSEFVPDNTMVPYPAIVGGNVDASYIESKIATPQWANLQVETYIPMQELRRGGYKTVANYLTYITEALECKKVNMILGAVDGMILSGDPNYIDAGAPYPSDYDMGSLALYLHDVSTGDTPIIFARNKYIMSLMQLDAVMTYATDAVKNMYNNTGFISQYAGCRLLGFSGERKLADGTVAIPDERIFGFAGKCGNAITRGETRVYEQEDINSEKVHLKVTGYQFGLEVIRPNMLAKIVLSN